MSSHDDKRWFRRTFVLHAAFLTVMFALCMMGAVHVFFPTLLALAQPVVCPSAIKTDVEKKIYTGSGGDRAWHHLVCVDAEGNRTTPFTAHLFFLLGLVPSAVLAMLPAYAATKKARLRRTLKEL